MNSTSLSWDASEQVRLLRSYTRLKLELDDARAAAQLQYDVDVSDCVCSCPDAYLINSVPFEGCSQHGLVCELPYETLFDYATQEARHE